MSNRSANYNNIVCSDVDSTSMFLLKINSLRLLNDLLVELERLLVDAAAAAAAGRAPPQEGGGGEAAGIVVGAAAAAAAGAARTGGAADAPEKGKV